MTKEKIISLAESLGLGWATGLGGMDDFLEAFYHKAQAEAFEDAAKLCDTEWNGDADTYLFADACNECAAAIREMPEGETKCY